VQYVQLVFTIFEVLEGPIHGEMNWKCPTTTAGTMNHAKPPFSTEVFAGAIISVVHYFATLQ
jgi:hypothetical protein